LQPADPTDMNAATDTAEPAAEPATESANAPAPRRRPAALPSSRGWLAAGQWFVTLLLCAFLIVPVVMSIVAGPTVNYFQGVASGLTLRWLDQVSGRSITRRYSCRSRSPRRRWSSRC
jgi:putative spermidine/putrescine transport system permease protein